MRERADRFEPKHVPKPWGYEVHWAVTDRYVGKLLHIEAGHLLSLQYHERKDESIYVLRGRMIFRYRDAAGQLVGTLELPLAVGIVGGATKVHPTAQAALR